MSRQLLTAGFAVAFIDRRHDKDTDMDNVAEMLDSGHEKPFCS